MAGRYANDPRVTDDIRRRFQQERIEYHRNYPYSTPARRGPNQCCVLGRLSGVCTVHDPYSNYDFIAFLEGTRDMIAIYGNFTNGPDENNHAGVVPAGGGGAGLVGGGFGAAAGQPGPDGGGAGGPVGGGTESAGSNVVAGV